MAEENTETVQSVEQTGNMNACKSCGKQISKKAKTCPHCGAKNGMSTGVIVLIVLLAVGALITCGIVSCTAIFANSVDQTLTDMTEDPGLTAVEDDTLDEEIPEEAEASKATLGSTVVFDGFEIAFGNKISPSKVNNRFSEHNGSKVIVVPVTVTTMGDETGSINMFYIKLFGSNGAELPGVSAYFDKDDIDFAGDLRPGASYDTSFHMLYDGDGDYYITLRSFSEEIEVLIPVSL